MQLTIDRATLARELALIAPAAEKKTTIPILSCVRLEARGDRLTLTATDLECGITTEIPAGVTQEGEICLPAKRLQAYVATLGADMVAIKTTENNYATVAAGRARARIAGMEAASYPELPSAPKPVVTMDARALSRAFARVSFAISMEESRFTINGALFVVEGGLVKCVATDGHRLAYVEWDGATCVTPSMLKALVPKHSIGHYAKLADQAEGGARVEFGADDNHLFFGIGPRLLIARKLTGNFPDYARVLPKHERYVTADREELESALERVMQFSDERSRAIRVKVSSGEIGLSAQSLESGESEESVACGGDLEIEAGFNARYILEAIRTITHPKVALFLADPKLAGEIRPMRGAGTEQDPYAVATDSRYVVMPMRL